MSALPAIITPNSEIIPPLNIESKLLVFLITAEMKQHSGLDTVMEKDEIKDYLEQVMVEVQKSRKIPELESLNDI